MTCGDEGSTCHEACACTRERYRREGAEAARTAVVADIEFEVNRVDALRERLAVVAFLRERAAQIEGLGRRHADASGFVTAAANGIERGEHIKGGG